MIKLDQPIQDAGDVFTICISKVRDPLLKARLSGILQDIIAASAAFDHAAVRNRLHTLVRQAMVGGTVTKQEMESVYTNRMAKKGEPGRDIYDALLTSTPQGKCPLCGHRIVSTLDHHLPKANFPALAVAPLNLVPSCFECNKSKLAIHPATASEETLHPYYDDIDGDLWLVAQIIQTQPAALRFFVQAPSSWSAVLRARVEHHFQTFDLGVLYSIEAAVELTNISYQLGLLHTRGGAESVKREMEDRAMSCQHARRNSWQTATYTALARSDWFCDGGFNT